MSIFEVDIFFMMKTVFINTEDSVRLTIHIFEPKVSNQKLLVINSATGVKQQFYFSFAQFFAQQGFTVITYDYRGIGMSKPEKMKGFNASMRLWGNQDFLAITKFVQDNYMGYKKYALGHSVGALILGMNPLSTIYDQFVFMATQNAYVGGLKTKTKLEAYICFGLLQPLTTQLFGYFPGNWFGLGESLPSGCAYDWRTLILNKKSVNRLLEKTENYSEELTQKTLVLWASDDDWLTENSVKNLLANTYPKLKPTYRILQASESDRLHIVHVNFFRSYNKKLWDVVLQELL